jgi:acyl-CoA reductase-like NAD-dependent aldehyde dehydrogenase
VLTGVTHDMLIMRDETFGPCIPVMAYKDTEQAIRLANDTEFGLAASVIAGTAGEAEAIGRRLNAGGVFLQDTFLTFAKLGTFGSDSFGCSGYGAPRIGPESLRRFLRRKSLLTQTGTVADIQHDHHLGTGK